jgi:hypothetical protein
MDAEIMRVDVITRRDFLCCKPDNLAIPMYCAAQGDASQGHFMSHVHELGNAHIAPWSGNFHARRQVDGSYRYIVVRVKVNRDLGERDRFGRHAEARYLYYATLASFSHDNLLTTDSAHTRRQPSLGKSESSFQYSARRMPERLWPRISAYKS